SFAAFVEWVLARNVSSFIVGFEDDLTCPTPDLEPSQTSPSCAELQPEPTADREPAPSATDKPSAIWCVLAAHTIPEALIFTNSHPPLCPVSLSCLPCCFSSTTT
ncbi:hypothetical protein M9458_008968, partial [Cirrhinus mrigala]